MLKYQLNDNASANEKIIITREKETLHYPLSVVVLETYGYPEAYPQMVIPNYKHMKPSSRVLGTTRT